MRPFSVEFDLEVKNKAKELTRTIVMQFKYFLLSTFISLSRFPFSILYNLPFDLYPFYYSIPYPFVLYPLPTVK